MGKPNKRHNELCKRYKTEGRREKNKAETAKKNERRIAKFAGRREKKLPKVSYVAKDPEERGSNRQAPIGDFAYRPRMDKMLPYQRERSFMQRIQNQLDAEILEKKKEEQSKKDKKKNKEG